MSDLLPLAITATLILYAVAMGIGMLTMLVLAIRYDSEMYFEGAMVMVLVGSVAMAKFLLRGEVI